jgi:hypothetical protein
MPFKLLYWILLAISMVACNSLPEKSVTHTAPVPTLALSTKTPAIPTLPATAAPTLTATPADPVCPPFSIDTALPVPDEPQNYIGLHFDTLPPGLVSPGGTMLDGSDTYYLLSEVSRDSGEMLWLERNICHDERGYPYQEIRAVLLLPALQGNEHLIMGTCRLKETADSEATNPPLPDPAIVAVGQFDDIDDPPVALTYAWRANPQTESFEVLPPESVTCTRIEGL